VLELASSGADVIEGVDALHGWGGAAAAIAGCLGIVPVIAIVTGPVISGPALLLGLADMVVMTPDAVAFVSGPEMVAEFTGVKVSLKTWEESPCMPGRAAYAQSNPTIHWWRWGVARLSA